ncbi:MAG: hypothetical protein ALECFALPRED_005834 [Alectoria fallacina]|uniref:Uncharacterized protein n=1 Tax=Alectoria fallacina TaxID=1903189 RepID=A0A8H3FZV7_9LECA|nr:MAG: hypothetical protein ALECFALPRED_005834 [Alectoria fallacina]
MPSFFFHIAFDIEAPATPLGSRLQAASRDEDQLGNEATAAKVIASKAYADSRHSIDPSSGGSAAQEARISHYVSRDWRYDRISVQDIGMATTVASDKHDASSNTREKITNGISAGPGGLATKGKYEPCDPDEEALGWGVVRLYRDSEETPGLYDEPTTPKHSKPGKSLSKKEENEQSAFREDDCTTLCILAVPSYLTPSDFLGFVGEKTRDAVSHFRMIRTERGNRYMVLMKFRNGKNARKWRREWNGKAFDGMEPENCHVVFVKSIEFRTHETPGQESSFPDMTNDPFTPSVTKQLPSTSTSSTLQAAPISSSSRSSKPHAPPTPSLVELPTCPVCLERMDESTGLLTILCQHVFHCSCLQKWRGSGCPVCRYTQDDLGLGKRTYNSTSLGDDTGLNECSVCRSDANLWICLICGNVGCGRYDAAHAFSHYEQSQHCFAMDMTTQRVWDYATDGYVHRIVQNKNDGKFVELTPTSTQTPQSHDDDFDDYVPREKMDNIGLEYTHLLTSQLDSQRMYFEEILERAADKASQAAQSAERATESSIKSAEQIAALQASHDTLANETIPALEKDRARSVRKAEKFEAMARKLEKEWRDEKAMNESLMTRITHLGTQLEAVKTEKAELEEQSRDLGFFISGMEKLKTVGVDEEDVREGTVSLPEFGEEAKEAKGKGKKKGGGKGKK